MYQKVRYQGNCEEQIEYKKRGTQKRQKKVTRFAI